VRALRACGISRSSDHCSTFAKNMDAGLFDLLEWVIEYRSGRAAVKLARRRFLYVAAGAAALPAVSRIASAQPYPTRPVTMVVFVPAGGTPDIIARLVGQSLSQRLGQSVIIDNRPGGRWQPSPAGGRACAGRRLHAFDDRHAARCKRYTL
jgi:hypothetical protein